MIETGPAVKGELKAHKKELKGLKEELEARKKSRDEALDELTETKNLLEFKIASYEEVDEMEERWEVCLRTIFHKMFRRSFIVSLR